jgi:hypothetical protein
VSDNPETSAESGAGADGSAEKAEAALAASLEERNRLWEQAHRARALEQELGEVRRMVADMESSLSWRITVPLRLAKARVVHYADLAQRARTRMRAG